MVELPMTWEYPWFSSSSRTTCPNRGTVLGGGVEETVTVTEELVVPVKPVAEAVYVVVAAGVTVVVPEGPKVPMPEMLTETALVLVQDRTEEVPGVIIAGCAVIVRVVFGVATGSEEEPPPPHAS
jgi:hypothetical protein